MGKEKGVIALLDGILKWRREKGMVFFSEPPFLYNQFDFDMSFSYL